jgi:hypothetical protein
MQAPDTPHVAQWELPKTPRPRRFQTGLIIGILVGGVVGGVLGIGLPRLAILQSQSPTLVSNVNLTTSFSIDQGFGPPLSVTPCPGANVAPPANWTCTFYVLYNGSSCHGCAIGQIGPVNVVGATVLEISPYLPFLIHSNQPQQVNLTLAIPPSSVPTSPINVEIGFTAIVTA